MCRKRVSSIRCRSELIDSARVVMLKTCWKVENSKERLDRSKKTRLQVLGEAKLGDHSVVDCGCLSAALEVLELNKIDPPKFTSDVRELLQFGRGKGRYLMIHGESNRAKSFILMPLVDIFETFMCPAQNKFNWVDAWSKEVIFLNDLNYTEETMSWGNFLNLLEGAPVSIGVPKNHFSEDVLWHELTPIFATAARPIVKITANSLDHVQTNMMNERWKLYHFTHEFDAKTRVRYEPCNKCFATLVLDY